MRKRYDFNDIVVYSQKKKQHHTVLQPYTRSKSNMDEEAKKLDTPKADVKQTYTNPKRNIDEVVRQLDNPKAEVKQLTDKDGLDRSYDANNYISITDNTV